MTAQRPFERVSRQKLASFCLETTNWAVIDRPYSSGINTVGAVYDRATSVRKSFETETSSRHIGQESFHCSELELQRKPQHARVCDRRGLAADAAGQERSD